MAIEAKMDMIGLVVADMAASLAFYRRLGLELPPGADEAPHVEVTLPGGTRLAWDTEDTIRSFIPDWTAPKDAGRVALAFRLADPAAVDAAYDELTARGHPGQHAPFDAPWGQRYAVVLDPDGVGVDLFAALPGAPA